MFTVKSPFVLNGKEYQVDEQVDPAILEAEDKADLVSRGLLVDPNAPVEVKPVKVKKEKVTDEKAG